VSRREHAEDGQRKHTARDRRTLRRAAAKRKHQALEPTKVEPATITHPVRR
jgi:hypothetical protein